MGSADRRHRQMLIVGGKARSSNRLNPPFSGEDPTPEQIGRAYQAGDWLAGGEPMSRGDFLRILESCGEAVSLRTDGLALADKGVVETIKARGVSRVCIPIYSVRPDAHDWLFGLSGAARKALKGIRVCVDAGLQVHVEFKPSRPTAGLMMETVGVLGRLGVHTVWVVRPRVDWMNEQDPIALTPRMGLLEPELKTAGAAARRLGLRIRWVGFSACTIDGLEGERWSDVWRDVEGRHQFEPEKGPPCPCCAPCEGYPIDYIHRFGWTEFEVFPTSRVGTIVRRAVARQGDFPRTTQGQSDRLRIAFGAPTPDWDPDFVDPITIEPSRVIRQRMVAAAQVGATTLYACNSGLLDHPAALDLVWEMTRLSFERVLIAGELSSLVDCSQRVMQRFRGVHYAKAVWLGPDPESHNKAVGRTGAFQAIPTVLQKLRDYSGAQTEVYAVLRTVQQLDGYLERFSELDQTPRFCLAASVEQSQLADRLPSIEDPQLKAHLGGLLSEELWSGPRDVFPRAMAPWGTGVPTWFSRIDPFIE